MVTISTFRKLAVSFPEVTEQPHFENTSFRVKNKIFITLDEKNKRACAKFSEIDQSSFCAYDPDVIYPVPNKWGKQGWTFINLKNVGKEMLLDAMTTAYSQVAPRTLSKKYNDQRDQL